MTATSCSNGNLVEWQDGRWIYSDGEEATEPRPCPKCGELPTPEGHDACLGELPNVRYACCGHGVEQGYVTKLDGTIRYLGG